MSFVDTEYGIKAFSVLRNFKQVSLNPFRLNASCPICGDSAKDKFKARFWFYMYQGDYLVHCYNCDATMSFQNYLKQYDETMYRDYLMDSRKESTVGRKITIEKPDLNAFKAKMPTIQTLDFCERLDKLPENHPILKYVAGRCIPKDQWNRLWFTTQWQELVNKHNPLTYDSPKTEMRLVIPIFNVDGEIESFQGRALVDGANIKYMTIKAHPDASKIYGCDRVDESKPFVWVMEGPIDSLFVPNSIAITGGALNLDSVPYPKKRVWVLDNEPRHKDVKSRVEKLISQGEKIVIWDMSSWKSKDVNDMIRKEGATPEMIESYFKQNVIHGLRAQLRSSRWFMV